MRKQRQLLIVFLLVLALVLSACGGAGKPSPTAAESSGGAASGSGAGSGSGSGSQSAQSQQPASTEKIVIKLAHQVAEQAALHQGALKFKEIVEQESGGAIEVQIFPAAQLGNEKDMIEGTKLGTIQMAIPSAAALANFYPPVGVFGMPYIWNGRDESEEYASMLKVVRGPMGDELAQAMTAATGILPLDFGWWYGDRHITNRVRPIQTPEDVRGLKIRTPDAAVNVAPIKALGATVVPMAFAEVYTALKTGTVDGQENPIAIIHAQKFHEVQQYISLTGHLTQNQVPIMNPGFFGKLSPEHQQLVKKAIAEAGNYQSQLQLQENIDKLEVMKQGGLKANAVDRDAFRAAIAQVVYEQFKDKIGSDLYDKVRKAQDQ